MDYEFTPREKESIVVSVKARYAKVAMDTARMFRFPTGEAGLKALGYSEEIISRLPEAAKKSFCGVGNPFSLGEIRPGDKVLDVGCGAGVDSLYAALLTDGKSEIWGIELTPEMLAGAKENKKLLGTDTVHFQEGSAEILPFPDGFFDVLISNGAYNLVVDKALALREACRVLAPGARIMIADQILVGDAPEDAARAIGSWCR